MRDVGHFFTINVAEFDSIEIKKNRTKEYNRHQIGPLDEYLFFKINFAKQIFLCVLLNENEYKLFLFNFPVD